MNISRANYELIFIDYVEGKLSAAQKEELYLFLDSNQDLKEEFEIFTSIDIPFEDLTTTYPDKAGLKKNGTTTVSAEQLIAYYENDLSSEEKTRIEKILLTDKKAAVEFERIQKSKMIGDSQIIFVNKNSLKKGGVLLNINPAFKRSVAVAASLLLLIASYYLLRSGHTQERMTAQIKIPVVAPISNSTVSQESPAEEKEVEEALKNDSQVNDKNDKKVQKQLPLPVLKTDPILIASHSQQKKTKQDSSFIHNTPVNQTVLVQAKEIKSNDSVSTSLLKSRLVNLFLNNDPIALIAPAINSPVFSQEEIREFEEMKAGSKDSQISGNALIAMAQAGLEKVGKLTDVTVDKKDNAGGNATTYALGVGKNFSISRIVAR